MYSRTRLVPMSSGVTYDQMKSVIGAALQDHGHVSRPLPAWPIEHETWRRAARAAARTLGRPVRTVVEGGTLHAWLTDWPRDDRERAVGVAPEVAPLREQRETAKVDEVSAAPAPRRAATARAGRSPAP